MSKEIAVVIGNANEKISPFETIEAILETGFKNVFIQWYNKELECTQEEQLKYVNKLGLNVIFAHLGYKRINSIWEAGDEGDLLVESYKRDIDICKENNIPIVVMHLTKSFIAPDYGEIGLNRIKTITEYAKEKNIKVAFENVKIKGYLEYVLSNIKDDNVGVCLDSGHLHAYYNDEIDSEMIKDRIFAVHLHDNDKSDDLHLLPFDGTINWNWLIKKLKECNYNGPITLEPCYRYEYLNSSPLEFYKKGYQIAEMLAEMFENNN